MKSAFIYGLTDPRTAVIHYVGKANDPVERYKAHLYPSALGKNTAKNNWIKKLLAEGVKPGFCPLERVEPGDDWGQAERSWIALVRRAWPGQNKNMLNGGQGSYQPRTTRPDPTATASQRFWSKVSKVEGGCWLWTGCCNSQGYPQLRMGRRTADYAHRFSYRLHLGPFPARHAVRQSCGNKRCVNPDHLYLTPGRGRRSRHLPRE
jgi:hypothetical protein